MPSSKCTFPATVQLAFPFQKSLEIVKLAGVFLILNFEGNKIGSPLTGDNGSAQEEENPGDAIDRVKHCCLFS